MAVSLVLPVVTTVARKAADELVKTITRMWGVDSDREKLERRLLAVQCLLDDAEEKSEANPAVRRWVKDLKTAAYRADDVLDHIQYEALRREMQSTRSMTNKVLSHFTRDNPLLFRLKASRELKDVLCKIDELVEEMNKFGLVEHAHASQVLYRQTHSSLDMSEEIYGRDDDKEKLVKLLLDHENQENVEVLPIIGMGGLGKTTLAKMVYNNICVQKHFQLKMWHCVSDNFEPLSLVRSVIELAAKERCDLPDNIELLRVKLVDIIGRQRFLLILDDVWNEDQHKWEEHLKPLLCSSIGGSGSIIVVTSRSPKVASIMGTLLPHEVACLSDYDSWKLFSKKAFSKGVQEKEEFVTIGWHIVDKCMGLPLALKTIGGLMSSKQAVSEWMAIADSNIRDTSTFKYNVLPILKLSYKYLSSEMKQCFTFCAMFPKDYEMEKDVLIQLWMANDFIHGEGTVDLTEKGEFIFNELVWRAFLQDVKETTYNSDTSNYYHYCHPKIVCKMHDLMHDLAKDATEEYACAQELIQEKALVKSVHHVQISDDEFKETKGLLKKASPLHTLLIKESILGAMEIKELKLKSLRALSCRRLSHSLAKYLKYLKYLDLSGTSIVRLPDSICIMYNLQTLRLNWCHKLRYLPEDLATSLKKLNHIYLLRCDQLQEMPPNMSLLCNLYTLTIFVVGTKDGCGIEELKGMKQLSNRLELYKLRHVKSGSKANLHEKRNLHELSLNWGHRAGYILTNRDIKNEEEVMESLVPPSDLKVLEVYGYHGLQIPQWMRDSQIFQSLKTLIIFDWPRCKDIPLNLLSSSLEKLHLAHMDNLTMLCKSIDAEAAGCSNVARVLPRLKCLTLKYLPNLERWTEEPHSLMCPWLEEVEVVGCPKLATLPEGPLRKQIPCRIDRFFVCRITLQKVLLL